MPSEESSDLGFQVSECRVWAAQGLREIKDLGGVEGLWVGEPTVERLHRTPARIEAWGGGAGAL